MAAFAMEPKVVASPAQAAALLAAVALVRPDFAACFGSLYYGAPTLKKPSPCAAPSSAASSTALLGRGQASKDAEIRVLQASAHPGLIIPASPVRRRRVRAWPPGPGRGGPAACRG